MPFDDAIQGARGFVGKQLDRAAAPKNSRQFVEAVQAARPHAKVAIGVGRRPLDGWINTDVTRALRVYLDMTKPWPVPPRSISRVYAEHVIEHLPLPLARRAYRNCAAALEPGGRIRLATPDLERAARAYLDHSEVGRQHLAYYGPSERITEHPVDLLRTLFAYDGHWAGYLYDFEALAEELNDAGFVDVVRLDPGRSADPVFEGLEARTDGTFFHMQLIVEASTPR
jgi:predicted SAM-dependent methyltransferase